VGIIKSLTLKIRDSVIHSSIIRALRWTYCSIIFISILRVRCRLCMISGYEYFAQIKRFIQYCKNVLIQTHKYKSGASKRKWKAELDVSAQTSNLKITKFCSSPKDAGSLFSTLDSNVHILLVRLAKPWFPDKEGDIVAVVLLACTYIRGKPFRIWSKRFFRVGKAPLVTKNP
jgi:hypothetical protein